MSAILTERDCIRSVRDRWNSRYPDDNFRFVQGETAGAVRKRLKRLNLDTCSRADVDKAIGRDGWADAKCDVCGKAKPAVLQFGDKGYDCTGIDICEDCLKEALVAFSVVPAE